MAASFPWGVLTYPLLKERRCHSSRGPHGQRAGLLPGKKQKNPAFRAHGRDRTRLEDLGCHSESAVRQLVNEWAGGTKVTEEQKEEVIALLLNLVRGAHF